MRRGTWKRKHERPSFPFHCYTNPNNPPPSTPLYELEPFYRPRFPSGRQRFASPAASDTSEAHRPDPRPYPAFPSFPTSSFSSRMSQTATVVCGGRVLPLCWQAGAGGLG